ncbi:FUSC family protein [Massilia polaris]|uniref:FUSC family protein n=1 Tax=Massilia polaris TaxID=2728846 RepID=UPI00351CEDAC
MKPLPEPTFDFVIFDSIVIGAFVGIALVLAHALQLDKPYWVPVSCLAVIQGSSLRAVWSKQLQRIIGTVLPDWGTVTLFLNDAFDPDAAQLAALEQRGVKVERTRMARIAGKADVILRDGRSYPMAGLFVVSQTLGSPLAEQLGCVLEEGPMGMYVRTDERKASTVAGVFCCGDAARIAGSVAFAVADGAMAGVAAHQSLVFGAVAAAA